MRAVHLALGATLLVEQRPWRVTSFDGRVVTLRALDDGEEKTTLPVEELVAAAGLRALGDESVTGPSRPALVDGLSEEELREALWRRHHVFEVLYGHPVGEWADPSEQPRAAYDPRTTTLGERATHKAAELRAARVREVSERTIRRWIDGYRADGLLGLVDKRRTVISTAESPVSPEVLAVLDELVAQRSRQSTKRLTNLRAELLSELRRRFPDHRLVGLREHAEAPVLRVPGRTGFYALLKARYRGSHLTGESKARQSTADMPPIALSPFRATRAGEVVQIDSTRLDLLALDRATGTVVRAELTVAVDAFDHSIRAVRVAAVGTRGVDVALMVFDMLRPVAWRPEWGSECAWNYQGIPERVVVDVGGERFPGPRPAHTPFGQPQTIVCDHGKIYLSKTFFGACEQFGISIQPAPPKTPNYKGVVEQAFDNIKELLIERLPAHTGRGAQHRGSSVDLGEMLFLDELEDLIIDWAVTVYHRRRHDGCRLPEAPQVAVTPNHMFEYSVQRFGFITVPPSPERMVACLPSKMVVLQNYGVNLNGLRYYHPVLDVWRVRRSPWEPESGKPKHPVHYDPRDLSRIWFYEPDDDVWVPLPRRNALHTDVPFNDAALVWVKRIMAEDGYRAPDAELLGQYMDAFLERHLAGQTLPQERRLVARMLDDARNASKVDSAVSRLAVVPETDETEPEAARHVTTPNPQADLSSPSASNRGAPAAPDALAPPIGSDGPALVDDDDDDAVEALPIFDDEIFAAAS